MIRFDIGTEVQTIGISAGPETLRGHRRDVATITTTGIGYAQAANLFVDGAKWYIVDGDGTYDWTAYTVAGPITDNRDGTLIVKIGKANTMEQDLQDELTSKDEIITAIAGKSVQTTKEAAAVRAGVESLFAASTMDDDGKISVSYLCKEWKPGKHEKGEVYNANGQTWECYQAYNNAINPDITPGNPAWYTFNRPLHGKSPETARPWVAPQGAHDMYHTGEYMIYTDGALYKCLSDTNFSPDDYSQAWEVQDNA